MTKAQRHSCYKTLLKRANIVKGKLLEGEKANSVKGGKIGGICDILSDLDYSGQDPITYNGLIELGSQKPKFPHNGFYWFENTVEGWDRRISIIEKAIKETAPKKKKVC